MVSAKTNGVSQRVEIVRNKDGSIRKAPGRKTKANNQIPAAATIRVGVMERLRECRTAKGISLEENVGEVSRMDTRQVLITDEHMEEDNHEEQADMQMENVILRSQVEALQKQLRTQSHPVISGTTSTQHRPELHTLVEPIQTNSSLISLYRQPPTFVEEPPRSNQLAALGGYKMKLEKFNGSASEDYDLWWADLQAFFKLYQCNDEAKVNLVNAHLGGEARRFIHNEDPSNIDNVGKIHALLKATFSKKQDWKSILLNIKQKAEENILDFSVRVRIAARNCMFHDDMEEMSIHCLKRGCLPYLSPLFDHCLISTPYDELIQLATQFERKQEANKKPKRKIDDIDAVVIDEDNRQIKRNKHEYSDNLKQLQESINSIKEFASNSNYRSSNNNPSGNYGNFRPAKRPNEAGKLNICYHCAKPNHRFNDCRSATQAEKESISNALSARKFDFARLREKAGNYEAKRSKPYQSSLNSSTPKQSGN
jgi:hypothetical protein